jgi:hypothetical protein
MDPLWIMDDAAIDLMIRRDASTLPPVMKDHFNDTYHLLPRRVQDWLDRAGVTGKHLIIGGG